MLFTIVTGLIGLGIVIFVHETGHFLAAKAMGIEVEAFSLGWGNPLVRFSFRGTEYRISSLPIGGYCKLKGEQNLQPGESPDSAQITAEEGSLFSVAPWRRIITFLAGPVSNLLFSVLILSLIWGIGYSIQTFGNRIILVSEYGSVAFGDSRYPADVSGLETGDRIISIDGEKVSYYRDIQELISIRADKTTDLSVERNGDVFNLTITPRLNPQTGGGIIGVSPWIEPVVEEVSPGSPASAAGIRPGDRIVAVQGNPVSNHLDFLQALQGHPLRFGLTVERKGERLDLRMVPDYDENGNPLLGISYRSITSKQQASSVIDAFSRGIGESFSILGLSIKSFALLFKGIDLQQAVSGPIRITYMVGQVASSGFSDGIMTGLISLFRFLSFLSIALFVMNLLPIPALDGGLIVITLFEMIRRKRISPKVFNRYQVFGFIFIMTLLVFTTFNDIFYFFTNH
ncbi:RIP metalloprotease RseP [Marispirochaeta aestuarii]|uniref:RIP metalloprotease RseP n=1 Tax=Marispirochaeta aestuarii TaxID=1963862 RepID=UPI0029C8F481|nr:RIP metalloprotease RseP [Marispirochaeta aestuarii]